MKRHAELEVGKSYQNRNGIQYKCMREYSKDCYRMRSEGGYELTAHIITLYDNGTIEWDYSTGGNFY